MEQRIIYVKYNSYEVMNELGERFMNFEFIKIGDERDSFIPGATYRKCIALKFIDNETGKHVMVTYNDGTYDHIYDYTHITYADEMTYNRIIGEDIDLKGETK